MWAHDTFPANSFKVTNLAPVDRAAIVMAVVEGASLADKHIPDGSCCGHRSPLWCQGDPSKTLKYCEGKLEQRHEEIGPETRWEKIKKNNKKKLHRCRIRIVERAGRPSCRQVE